MADEKISAMTALPNPPSMAGAMVPVVQPGDATNYQSPIITLLTGANGTATTPGESITIRAGDDGTAVGEAPGDIAIQAGNDVAGGGGGSVTIQAGFSANPTVSAGDVNIAAGDGSNGGFGGGVAITSGAGGGADVPGANVSVSCGAAGGGNAQGGDIELTPGAGAGTGRHGLVIVSGVPTADPHVANALWSNAGVLTVSAG